MLFGSHQRRRPQGERKLRPDRERRRPKLVAVATLLLVLALAAEVEAGHSEDVCGQNLEYQPPPSDDIRHGYGQLRLRTSSGEVSIAFHHTNPANAPSRTEQGATQRFVNVCISGPYVHVVGATPYVSPYDLRLAASPSPVATPGKAPVTSLPSTTTSAVAVAPPSPQSTPSALADEPRSAAVVLLGALGALIILAVLARRFGLRRNIRRDRSA